MSLKLVIVAVHLLLLIVVDFSSGNFCDQGPPGRYCYKDLTGWYDCKIDAKTQKMTETKHNCPPNKRCQCFYGPSCSANITDPCATYQLPPPLPKVFSTFYTTTVTNCKNKACTTVTNIGEMLQNATAGEQRIDEIGISWTTRFIFPFQYIENDDYIQFDTAWFKKSCILKTRSIFPRFGVPYYFTCDLSEKFIEKYNATLKMCSWESGGRSKTEMVSLERWFLESLPDGRYKPYMYQSISRPTPSSNNTEYTDTMYYSFFTDFLDPSQLTMPTFCAQGVAAFYKTEV